MDDPDDMYVMADPASAQGAPIKSSALGSKWLGLIVAGIVTFAGAVLSYVAIAKKPPNLLPAKTPTSDRVSTAPPAVQSPPVPAVPLKVASPTPPVIVAATPVKETIYFAFDDANILPSEVAKLQSFFTKVKGEKGTLVVEGHSDDSGLEEYNQELSQARADQVVKVLKKIGMNDVDKVTIQGFGETRPAASNNTEEGMALNRRVAISFVRDK
jgi:outer membrane protein OmpA-like peptidoglycan-associated protein